MNPVLRLVGYMLAASVPCFVVLVAVVATINPPTPVAGLIGTLFGTCAVIAGQVLFYRWLERQP